MSPIRRILAGLRLAGAKMLVDPLAVQRWQKVLAERERQRERREWDELVRRMNGDDQ